MSHRYRLTYEVKAHPASIGREDVPEGHGACDAVLLASIIYPPDGSYSVLFVGEDGRTGKELADSEWFKVWAMLARRLSLSETLDEGRKELAAMTFEAFRAAILAKRDAH